MRGVSLRTGAGNGTRQRCVMCLRGPKDNLEAAGMATTIPAFVVACVVFGVLWDMPVRYILLSVVFAAFLIYLGV